MSLNDRLAHGYAHYGAMPTAVDWRDVMGVGGVGPWPDHDGRTVPERKLLRVDPNPRHSFIWTVGGI